MPHNVPPKPQQQCLLQQNSVIENRRNSFQGSFQEHHHEHKTVYKALVHRDNVETVTDLYTAASKSTVHLGLKGDMNHQASQIRHCGVDQQEHQSLYTPHYQFGGNGKEESLTTNRDSYNQVKDMTSSSIVDDSLERQIRQIECRQNMSYMNETKQKEGNQIALPSSEQHSLNVTNRSSVNGNEGNGKVSAMIDSCVNIVVTLFMQSLHRAKVSLFTIWYNSNHFFAYPLRNKIMNSNKRN